MFWYDDADMVGVYVKAFERKQEHANREAWLSGVYNHHAVSVAIGNAFKKKGSPPIEYMTKPIELRKKEKDEQAEVEKLYKQFSAVASRFNTRRKRKG